MTETTDIADETVAPKKKGKLKKLLIPVAGALVLVGGGAAGGLYAATSGLVGGGGGHGPVADDKPHLVPKGEGKHAAAAEGEGAHGGGEGGAAAPAGGKPTPAGSGGEKFASNYYAMEKDFTANLQDSPHFLQVGIAVSTPYDDKVIDNLKANDIAIRSAVLLALGDTTEDQVFTSAGKRGLQQRLAAAINGVLQQKEGFGGVGNVYFTNFVVQ